MPNHSVSHLLQQTAHFSCLPDLISSQTMMQRPMIPARSPMTFKMTMRHHPFWEFPAKGRNKHRSFPRRWRDGISATVFYPYAVVLIKSQPRRWFPRSTYFIIAATKCQLVRKKRRLCSGAKKRRLKEPSLYDVGSDLFFRSVSRQVSSAQSGLTSVFGMGTGGPPM